MTRLALAAASFLFAAYAFAAAFAQQAPVEWSGCLAGRTAVVARVGADRLRFCGRITDASVNALRAELASDDRTLEIMSLGGELDAPVRLGEIVLDRRLSVEVIGPCVS